MKKVKITLDCYVYRDNNKYKAYIPTLGIEVSNTNAEGLIPKILDIATEKVNKLGVDADNVSIAVIFVEKIEEEK